MRQRVSADGAALSCGVVSKGEAFKLSPAMPEQAVSLVLPGSAFAGPAQVRVSEKIVVEGALQCGLSTRVAVEPSHFRAVAAILSLDEKNAVVCEIVLLHRDPSLNVPLARSDDMVHLAADWQAWARRFNLPLVLIEPDGVEQMISNRLGSLDVHRPEVRRSRGGLSGRRPRFLVRRKVGNSALLKHIEAREIIART